MDQQYDRRRLVGLGLPEIESLALRIVCVGKIGNRRSEPRGGRFFRLRSFSLREYCRWHQQQDCSEQHPTHGVPFRIKVSRHPVVHRQSQHVGGQVCGSPDGFSHDSKTPIIRPRYRSLSSGTCALNHFADRLAAATKLAGNVVCVGLDPRWETLPEPLRSSGRTSTAAIADAYVSFCHGVIDVVASVVPIVKVQAAFFEELGPSGMAAMADVILYAEACGLLVIVDGKRNDIGSTAEAYAGGYLGREGSNWHADALTVSPYLGDDSLAPFVEIASERGAGIFVLVKTTNPGGKFLQDVICDGEA